MGAVVGGVARALPALLTLWPGLCHDHRWLSMSIGHQTGWAISRGVAAGCSALRAELASQCAERR